MVWGRIRIGGRIELISPNGLLRAQQYLDKILQTIVRPFSGAVGEYFRLMQDNARAQVALIVTN